MDPNPLYETVFVCCELGHCRQISVKLKSWYDDFHTNNYLNTAPAKSRPFCPALSMLMPLIGLLDHDVAFHAVMHILHNSIKLFSEASYLTVKSAVDEIAMFTMCFTARAEVSFGVSLNQSGWTGESLLRIIDDVLFVWNWSTSHLNVIM